MADEASTGGVKRKRGGQRQRLARAAAEDAAPETDSKLSEYLLDQVAWGYMSPQQVQQIADLAHCDVQAALATERVPNNLVPLANAGTRGAHPNKCYADVMKAATKSSDVHVSNPVLVSLPFRKPVGERLQAVLLPHQLFSDIYHHHPATWEQCILGQPGDLERFWELTSGDLLYLIWGMFDKLHCGEENGQTETTWGSSPCTLCQCTKYGVNSWMDFAPGAAWQATCWSPAAWKAWGSRSRCILFEMSNLSACNVAMDWMHIKYLGADQYNYASVLFLLTHHILPGTPASNMEVIWKELLHIYKRDDIPSRFRYLNTVRMFLRKNNIVKLRGKASEIRHLHGPILEIWRHHMVEAVSVHRKILVMLKLNSTLEGILTNAKGDFVLSAEDAEQFQDATMGWLLLQKQLEDHFSDSDVPLFNVTEKSHFIEHACLLSKFINPRVVWCFAGEDQQRRTQKLAETCVKGLGPAKASLKMMSRYRLALGRLFSKHGQE
ncbi:hypothetical protein AK812_SmicGene15091 [Symbiodinium microadriaticum]|uniref:Uncharacterized protein n=1 Tax=Symbiodinium microadriaticum TaxID=2951 RepID=A0A1Q9E3V1_SYMMI|nr:hypothetical protein AK812_SmicGene15091 [Symbiodinium microadriaticum]CAE7455354.1 unnamed protein product [Symbiodinium microadriaticum]CAE7675295.1 unnamed protein product [Symbiodinium sp. KB8]